jgi:hypothetical protein
LGTTPTQTRDRERERERKREGGSGFMNRDSYTGNTKVPIRTSNSERYRKYKSYREK